MMRFLIILCWLALAGSYANAAQGDVTHESPEFGKTVLCSGDALKWMVNTMHLDMERTDHLAMLNQVGVSCQFYEYSAVRQVQQFGNGRDDSDNGAIFCAWYTQFRLKESSGVPELYRWVWKEGSCKDSTP